MSEEYHKINSIQKRYTRGNGLCTSGAAQELQG